MTMPPETPAPTIAIPKERLGQMAFALRAKANEFHGAIAREPEADDVDSWKASAAWFDQQAEEIRKAFQLR